MLAKESTLDEVLWLVSSFAAIHRVAFDPSLFAQRCPPPIARESFEQALAELGFASAWSTAGLRTVLSRRLPVAVSLREVKGGASDWVLVLNADERSAWVLERGSERPE